MDFQEMKERIGDKFGVPLILNSRPLKSANII